MSIPKDPGAYHLSASEWFENEGFVHTLPICAYRGIGVVVQNVKFNYCLYAIPNYGL